MQARFRWVIGFNGLMALCGAATAQELPKEPVVCEYPRLKERLPFASLNPTQLATAGEVEPNNTAAAAQAIPMGFGGTLQQDVDINGGIGASFDKDWFRFDASRGDTVGVAVLAVDGASLDSLVAIRDANGSILLQNDQHGGKADLYPPESPFPAGGIPGDSALTFTAAQSGTYFVQVEGRGAATGGYLAQIRIRKPPLLGMANGSRQILFLDFDGANGVHADELFGSGGTHNASLTRFEDFLPNWGIPANRRDAIIDKIVANARARFDQLLAGTTSQIVIRNSKDHSDSFGQTNVSRVIVGGRISELGISTIGIAEHVDPGNFSTTDTAVVLLDLLSAPSDNPNSVLSLPRAPGLSIEDAVAHVVSCVIVHEACHFLGCWHVDNANTVLSLIDQGGNLRNRAGIGGDGILGTSDDVLPLILDDKYAFEGIARTQDTENVRAQVIAALAVGSVGPVAEAAVLRDAIARIEAARRRPVALEAKARFSPANTRNLVGLPAIENAGDARARLEDPEERFKNAIGRLDLRLKAVESGRPDGP